MLDYEHGGILFRANRETRNPKRETNTAAAKYEKMIETKPCSAWRGVWLTK